MMSFAKNRDRHQQVRSSKDSSTTNQQFVPLDNKSMHIKESHAYIYIDELFGVFFLFQAKHQ